MSARTVPARTWSSLAVLACVGALGVSIAGGGGCSSAFGNPSSSQRIQVDLETPANELPTRATPRAISFTAPDSYVVKLSALNQDGSVNTSFNGYVHLTSKPGTVTSVTGNNTNGLNALLTNGIADQVTVSVLSGFGDTRIWAEDEGYVPVDPARVPPPACSNGLDDNDNGKIDSPNDPGCYSSNDDTEDPGTYTAGVSPPLWYELPRIADVRGVSQGGTGTSFPSDAVTIDTGFRGNNSWTYGSDGCTDSSCAGVVVTYVSSAGFFATDLGDDDPTLGRGYGSVYAYNFSAPANMRQCDRLRTFGGTSSDFFGFTEINYPTWELEEWDPSQRPCLIPEPHQIQPTCLLPNNQAIPDCYPMSSAVTMLKVAAALVRVETTSAINVHIGAKMGPNPGCCGYDTADPCCCGGVDPKAPACTPGTTLPTCTAAGQASTVVCALGPDATNCDLNHDGTIDRTSTNSAELTCSNNCEADHECSEYSAYLSQNQFNLAVSLLNPDGTVQANGTLDIQGDGSSDAQFNPVTLKGQNVRSFTGTLFYFSGGSQFTIQARCEDDIVMDMTQSPIASDTACVHARTILDNSDGSN